MGKKGLEEPNPYVTLTVGRQEETTQIKLTTCDPRWEENFKFLVNDPNIQTLEVEVSGENEKNEKEKKWRIIFSLRNFPRDY